MRWIAILFFSICTLTASAKAKQPIKKVSRRPATDGRLLTATSVIGDKVSVFKIDSGAEQSKISMSNSVGQNFSKPLPAADLKFILQEFDKLQVVGKVGSSCNRTRIDVVRSDTPRPITKAVCLSGRTINQSQYINFLNMLVTALM